MGAAAAAQKTSTTVWRPRDPRVGALPANADIGSITGTSPRHIGIMQQAE